jgi:Competence-damaged protein
MISADLLDEATTLLDACRARGWGLATAESCISGLIAAALTAIAGSSDVVDCGFVAYSNKAKMAMLGVPGALIAEHGAVSEPVTRAMAEGALALPRRSRRDPRGHSRPCLYFDPCPYVGRNLFHLGRCSFRLWFGLIPHPAVGKSLFKYL